jgi:hypothetical protein
MNNHNISKPYGNKNGCWLLYVQGMNKTMATLDYIGIKPFALAALKEH